MNILNQESIPNPNPPEHPSGSQPSGNQEGASLIHKHARSTFGWIGGAILTLLGVTFLFHNLGLPYLPNWWALFILIPAFSSFVAARNRYQDNNRLTRGAAGSLTVGILLTIQALVFLLNLDVGLFWPVPFIVGGMVLMGTAFMPA